MISTVTMLRLRETLLYGQTSQVHEQCVRRRNNVEADGMGQMAIWNDQICEWIS